MKSQKQKLTREETHPPIPPPDPVTTTTKENPNRRDSFTGILGLVIPFSAEKKTPWPEKVLRETTFNIHLPQEGGSKFQAPIQVFISCNHSSPIQKPGANFKFRFTKKGEDIAVQHFATSSEALRSGAPCECKRTSGKTTN